MREADNAEEVARCYPLMRQLRPALASAEELAERWARQTATGYRLLVRWREADGEPVAAAGYRYLENLIFGLHLYVDDLITDEKIRGGGHGAALLLNLRMQAAQRGCTHLTLDSGMSNALAHRFYFREGLLARALHFAIPTEPQKLS